MSWSHLCIYCPCWSRKVGGPHTRIRFHGICHWLPATMLPTHDGTSLSLTSQIYKMGTYSLHCLPGFLGFGKGGRRGGEKEKEKKEEGRAFWLKDGNIQMCISLSFKVRQASACHPSQPPTIYVTLTGYRVICALRFLVYKRGTITPSSQGVLRSEPGHPGDGATWSLDSWP